MTSLPPAQAMLCVIAVFTQPLLAHSAAMSTVAPDAVASVALEGTFMRAKNSVLMPASAAGAALRPAVHQRRLREFSQVRGPGNRSVPFDTHERQASPTREAQLEEVGTAEAGEPQGTKGGKGSESEDEIEIEMAEEHEKASGIADAVAVMLLGMVAFQISLFHLVNFPDKDIQHFTWMSLSQTASIFCAVLIWTTIKMSIEYAFGENPGDGRTTATGTQVTVMVLFFLMFIVMELTLAELRNRPASLHVLGTLGAHTVGFAAVDAFGEMQQAGPWNDNPMFSLANAAAVMVVLFVLCLMATQARKHYAVLMEVSEDAEVIERWEEVSCEFENEFCGFVTGLLICAAIIYSVTGHLPPIQGSPFNRTRQEVLELGLWSIGVGTLLTCFIIYTRKFKEDNESKAFLRAIEVIETCLAMTFGWCFLFTGRWLFWVSTNDKGVGDGDLMSARMVQALAFSFFVLALIFPLDALADNDYIDEKGTRVLMGAFGLLLGLSWEGAFDQAIEALGRELEDTPQRQFLGMAGMSVALCVVVLPSWAMYVLPAALEGKAHFSGKKKEEESKISRMIFSHD